MEFFANLTVESAAKNNALLLFEGSDLRSLAKTGDYNHLTSESSVNMSIHFFGVAEADDEWDL